MGYVSRVPWVGGCAADRRPRAIAPPATTGRRGTTRWRPSATRRARSPSSSRASSCSPPTPVFGPSQREGADRQATLRRLDAAIKTYTELLKKSPGDADAAYNYEYVVRLRDTMSKAKPLPPGKREDPAKLVQKLTGVVMAGDLPDGRTVHGDPGRAAAEHRHDAVQDAHPGQARRAAGRL